MPKSTKRNRMDNGMFLVPTVAQNPRRKGSHGYNSLQIFIVAKKANKKITLGEAKKKGARPRDIGWDLEHGNLKAVRKAS